MTHSFSLVKNLVLTLAILASTSCAHHPVQAQEASVIATHLVNPDEVDTLHLIPAPPVLHSKASNLDFKILHRYQKNRTSDECARAGEEAEFKSFITFFQIPRGSLTASEVATIQPFFDQLLTEARPVWAKGKKFWLRPRPYVTDPSLHPCVKLENTFAYPSGHASASELYARVLSDLFPTRKDSFLHRAKEIGEDRLIGGVHHPSDVREGQKLADIAYETFKKDSQFMAAFNLLKSKL